MANRWHSLKLLFQREKILFSLNITIMTLTFLFLGVFMAVVAYSQSALKQLENQAQITVFFKDDFSAEDIFNLQKQYENDERISNIKYVSKEMAYNLFKEISKNDPLLLESLSPGILPASLEIRATRLAYLADLSAEFLRVDGVEEVKFFKDVIDKFKFWSLAVYIAGGVLLLAFLSVSYAVIIATIRMTIHLKGQELEIQKLVGASDTYIKAPMIFQGLFFGVVSALIAGSILFAIGAAGVAVGFFSTNITFAFAPGFSLHPLVFSGLIVALLLLSGLILGYFGSLMGVKKYLKY